MIARYSSALFLCSLLAALVAAAQPADECRECPPPSPRSGGDMDVILRNHPPLRNCLSAKRVMLTAFGAEEQGLLLRYRTATGCADTTVRLQDVESFSMASLGIGGQPLVIPVLPAREFFRETGLKEEGTGFFEITALGGYGGKDTSQREVGFNSIYVGGELLISIWELAKNLDFAVGGGVIAENGRTRFPVQGHVRWSLGKSSSLEDARDFLPGPCKFRLPGESPAPGPGEDYVETATAGSRDSTVYLVREKRRASGGFTPFLFAEGGIIFSTGFDGAGRNPSVNPDEYGEYFVGAGLGLPIADFLTASLAYRYLRLNLRTPCPTCPPDVTGNPDNFFIQNANTAHTVLLKFGWKVW
ncbi:MAG: hypothetical protein DYG96_10025 [Chlorobi bacterium CHB2]|nr:hypothetical protein [Chlorobi bacterium CHB2]